MTIQFTAAEALELARQIEIKAEAFYRQAAETAADSIGRDLFANLATMEHLHGQIFEGMKFSPVPAFWPTPRPGSKPITAEEAWPVLAGNMVQDIDVELPKFFAQKRSCEDIIKGAMDFERDTIIFFMGLKSMMAGSPEMRRMDDIMKEEMGHLITLGSQLARLGRV